MKPKTRQNSPDLLLASRLEAQGLVVLRGGDVVSAVWCFAAAEEAVAWSWGWDGVVEEQRVVMEGGAQLLRWCGVTRKAELMLLLLAALVETVAGACGGYEEGGEDGDGGVGFGGFRSSFGSVLLIQILEIEVNSSVPLRPPTRIFTSETIRVLILCGKNIVLKVPKSVSLPKLKVLHLYRCDIQFDSNSLKIADEGCPLLEELELIEITFPDIAVIGISLPTLKRIGLTIGYEKEFRIDIHAPQLQHIYCGLVSCLTPDIQFHLVNCGSLVSAKFSSYFPPLAPGSQWYFEFLREFKEIKELHLSEIFLMCFIRHADSLPTFPHLIRLELSATEDIMWILLQRSPVLEELDCYMPDRAILAPLENEPLCLTQNLREIRIRNFKGDEPERELVRYFLQHGGVLKRMIIERSSDSLEEWPALMWKPLTKLRRRSPKFELELV
ncbi:OLC1v1008450C1 [Oldenlandia corymbosa var. corymbosa]|uniref:OLC1v1008450C1 n=1 Tax=Oldenlandia corymbosa var. corymbosa TaxID=529605 RepID=A0AAV1DN57_OLDCO|nr:OLC1v1008450C1 [Oldenlandia corymbosa var. corymbosa]